jgi:hypothetical protein
VADVAVARALREVLDALHTATLAVGNGDG